MSKNRKLSNPNKESVYHTQNELLKQGRIKELVYKTCVEPCDFLDLKVANGDVNKMEEILTLDRKQIIKYNGIEIKTE